MPKVYANIYGFLFIVKMGNKLCPPGESCVESASGVFKRKQEISGEESINSKI